MCLRAILAACLYHFLGIFTRVLNSVSQKSALVSINSHLSSVYSAPSPALDPQNSILSWVPLVTSWLRPAAPSLGRHLMSSAQLYCDWALDIGFMDRKKEEERDTCCLTGEVSASSSGKWEASVLARRHATCAGSEGLNPRAKIFGCRNPDAPQPLSYSFPTKALTL